MQAEQQTIIFNKNPHAKLKKTNSSFVACAWYIEYKQTSQALIKLENSRTNNKIL